MVYPMFAMVALTIIVGLVAFRTRVLSVKSGTVQARSFKLMDTDAFPESVVKTSRNFNNQFEIPILFYVAALTCLHFDLVNNVTMVLAWTFVLSRYAHAFIHLGHNHLLHRIIAFWVGVFAIMIWWIYLILSI